MVVSKQSASSASLHRFVIHVSAEHWQAWQACASSGQQPSNHHGRHRLAVSEVLSLVTPRHRGTRGASRGLIKWLLAACCMASGTSALIGPRGRNRRGERLRVETLFDDMLLLAASCMQEVGTQRAVRSMDTYQMKGAVQLRCRGRELSRSASWGRGSMGTLAR